MRADAVGTLGDERRRVYETAGRRSALSGRAEVDEQRTQYRERGQRLEFPNVNFHRANHAGKIKRGQFSSL